MSRRDHRPNLPKFVARGELLTPRAPEPGQTPVVQFSKSRDLYKIDPRGSIRRLTPQEQERVLRSQAASS